MEGWIIEIVERFGYVGIAFLIALENIFPPIPSEVILTFGGFLTTVSELEIWGVVLSATAGSVAGAVVLYSLGRWLDPARWERWLDGRPGKLLHLKKEDLRRARAWFLKRGRPTVFFCRFIPIVRSLISVPAGMSRMDMGTFLLLTAGGTVLWNTVLVLLGAYFGASWKAATGALNAYSVAAVLVLLAAAAAFAFVHFRKKRRKP